MKKKSMFVLAALVLSAVLLLAGCGCQHEWVEADCVTAKTCSLCQKVEGEALGHSWVEASCEAPKTCSVCGETQGEALGHDWQDVTCDTPQTCKTCGSVEGTARGHSCRWQPNVGANTMTGECDRCHTEQTVQLEPMVVLYSLLDGSKWNADTVILNGTAVAMPEGYSSTLSFDNEGGATWLDLVGTEYAGEWSYLSSNIHETGFSCAIQLSIDQGDLPLVVFWDTDSEGVVSNCIALYMSTGTDEMTFVFSKE